MHFCGDLSNPRASAAISVAMEIMSLHRHVYGAAGPCCDCCCARGYHICCAVAHEVARLTSG